MQCNKFAKSTINDVMAMARPNGNRVGLVDAAGLQ
jgi:hypothetical protein